MNFLLGLDGWPHWRRALRIGLPSALALTTLALLPFQAACFCGGPVRPTMETCSGGSGDFSGVTGVEIIEPTFAYGSQGGMHFQFALEASGTGVGDCVTYSGTLRTNSGSFPISGAVRASSVGELTTTRTIYAFSVYGDSSAFELEITALGHTDVYTVGSVGDAGVEDAGRGDVGEGDAGEGDAGETDAGESDAGESDAGESDAGESDAGESDAGESDAG